MHACVVCAQEWLNKKAEAEKENRRRTKETQKSQAEQKEEQRKRSEEAFNEWKKNARNRPNSAKSSFGYTSGKLTGACVSHFSLTLSHTISPSVR